MPAVTSGKHANPVPVVITEKRTQKPEDAETIKELAELGIKTEMGFHSDNAVKNADIIVIAIGKCGFLDNAFKFKKEAIIVDVGINRVEGKLHGDALPELPVKFQTPVPGGVGLLTRLTLLTNLLEAYNNGF